MRWVSRGIFLCTLAGGPLARALPERVLPPDAPCLLDLQNVFDPAIQPEGIPHIVESTSSAVMRAALPEPVDNIIQSYGPFQQPSAVQVFPDGSVGVYGTKTGVGLARRDVVALKDTVHKLTGTNRQRVFRFIIDGKDVSITIATSLVGSARVRRAFSDIDAELTAVVRYDGFKESDFHDPNSVFAKAMEMYIHEYMAQAESNGLIFSEAKAGNLDHVPEDAASTKSRAVKWSRNDIDAGYRMVPTLVRGEVPMLFREGLVSHSRIKFDWFMRLAVPPELVDNFAGMTDRIVEGSVMFNLAGQNGNNSAVPFVAQLNDFPELGATGGHIAVEGYADNKPLKVTSLFFDAEDYELARSVTVTAPFTPIFFLGRAVTNAANTYREQGKIFKSLRILYSRLNYANDVEAYRVERTRQGRREVATFRQLLKDFEAIIEDPTINELNILLSSAKDILRLQSLGVDIDADAAILTRAINNYSQHTKLTILGISEESALGLQMAINMIALNRMEFRPHLRDYVDYVLRGPQVYHNPVLPPERLFISFNPTAQFQKFYADQVPHWKEKYPHLEFEHPSDLHMTIAFLGQLSVEQRYQVQMALSEFASTLRQSALNFVDPSFTMVGRGRDDGYITLFFDPQRVHGPLRDAIVKFKKDMLLIGVKPDRHLEDFTPHITICKLPKELQGERGHSDFMRFLANEQVSLADLGGPVVDNTIRIMYRALDAGPNTDPVYRDTTLGEYTPE